MGRPVKKKWIGTTPSGDTAQRDGVGGDMMGIANLTGSNVTVLIKRQVSSRRFLVKDSGGSDEGIVRLVNAVEQAGNLTTSPALSTGEMIMNCKRQDNSYGRIVKMMNNTCIVQPAAAGASTDQFKARWDFAANAAAATDTSLEIVQIEDGSNLGGFIGDGG